MSKKTFRRCVHVLLLLCLILAGGIFSFYHYINWKGETEWAELIAELKAKGEPSSWQDVVPVPIPDQDNFCAIAPLACLFDYTKTGRNSDPIYKNPVLVDEIEQIKLDDPDLPVRPARSSRGINTLTDLKLWQNYYQNSKVFPKSPHPQNLTPAASVIIALNRYDKQLSEILRASQRPEARFFIHYEEEPKFSISLQHFGFSLNLSNVLGLRAVAYLQAGQSAKAWNDLQVLLKLHLACEKEPTILSHLIGTSITGILLDSLWEGLALKTWNNNELKDISQQLGKLNFLEEYQQCARGETMFFAIPLLDYLKMKREPSLPDLVDMNPAGRKLVPKGSYDIAKVTTVHLLYDRILPLIDVQKRQYSFATASLFKTEEENSRIYSPTDLMRKIFTPAYRSAAQKLVETQADVDMARIACALELFHRETGKYPDNLQELIGAIPHDIITGLPYHYALTSNGRYRLWSIGWDQVDDSGKVLFRDRDKRHLDRNHGDWTWAYPDNSPAS